MRGASEGAALDDAAPLDVEGGPRRDERTVIQRVRNARVVSQRNVCGFVRGRPLAQIGRRTDGLIAAQQPEQAVWERVDAWIDVVDLVRERIFVGDPDEDIDSNKAQGTLMDAAIRPHEVAVHEAHIGVKRQAARVVGPDGRSDDVGDGDHATKVGNQRRLGFQSWQLNVER